MNDWEQDLDYYFLLLFFSFLSAFVSGEVVWRGELISGDIAGLILCSFFGLLVTLPGLAVGVWVQRRRNHNEGFIAALIVSLIITYGLFLWHCKLAGLSLCN